jgi:SAM-dependent methyltransferase
VHTFVNARAPHARFADALSVRARAHRLALLRRWLPPGARVLDVGCGDAGLPAIAPDLNITGVDVRPRPSYAAAFVLADATEELPFGDRTFDLAYSNSVIEHLPPDRWARFAAELRRVSRGWFVQTPAWEFPVEPHALLPFAHWLPMPARRVYWQLGAGSDPASIQLLRRSQLEALFGPAIPEPFGPLTKSWICIQLPCQGCQPRRAMEGNRHCSAG